MGICEVEYKNSLSVNEYNFLRKSVGWKEVSIKQAKIGINNSAYLVTAVIGDKTIGMARVVSDGGYYVLIVDFIVLPEYQNKGIGKTMMNMIMEYIDKSVSKGEEVFVNLMSAKGRESFYKQFGFKERPDGKVGAGMTRWVKNGDSKP